MRVCYSKMHGCKDIPLVVSIFSLDESSPVPPVAHKRKAPTIRGCYYL